MNLNGRAAGDAYLEKVVAYLNTHPQLPLSANGTVSIAALAEATSVPTQSLHKNRHIRALLEQAAAAQHVRFWADGVVNKDEAADGPSAETAAAHDPAARKVRSLERELKTLAQQNAALVAENAELRQRLSDLQLQLNRAEYLAETGRRVAAPSAKETP